MGNQNSCHILKLVFIIIYIKIINRLNATTNEKIRQAGQMDTFLRQYVSFYASGDIDHTDNL